MRMNQARINQADGNWLESGEPGRPSHALTQFMEVADRIQAELESQLKALGLTSSRFEVLRRLLRAGEPVPLRVLAKAQKCVPSYITNIVDRLEADGLVRRVDDPFDRRSRRALLTSLGEIRANEGIDLLARLSARVERAMGPQGAALLDRLQKELVSK